MNSQSEQYHLLTLTSHAACRLAQRAIPAFVVEALMEVGVRDHDHCGGIRVHVHHHRAKQHFIQHVGREAGERFSICYCVIDSETGRDVITVGWINTRRTTDAQPRHRRGARRHH